MMLPNRSLIATVSLAFVLAFSFSLPTDGQQRFSGRLENLANQLVRQSRDVADRLERDYRRGFNNGRRDVQQLYQARMFVAGADLLAQMTREGRPENELNDAVEFLRSQVNFEPGWGNLRGTLDDLSRELRFSGRDPGRDPGGGRQGGRRNDGGWNDGRVTGRMRWFGRVDDEIYIYVQDNVARTELISGQPTLNERFSFTSPLPRRTVSVSVNRLRGRGRVEVFQQPSVNNNFTAVVRITDPGRGATDMEFELIW
ncbi:MAG: hypothetical protein SNJ62_00615 [Chloracidobacterium sp.]|uniref:Uncharacterized protein n=1 Tax=Chloracidobacterium validum TaxID=2821543 RepID=A0ABX8BAG8_9BACT|nr:hypothetical protein [Chloracidobacterium validum]QUW02055.1 hypothetical protein J8C06_06685 [Chloracidobacterium validum]